MTTTIHTPAPARHRRATDRPEVREVDSWLDPETSPLAVYADRDLPFAPVAVQRDRGVVATRTAGAAPSSAALPTTPVGGPHVRSTRTVVGLVAALVVVVAVLALVLGGAPSTGPGAGPGGGPGPGTALSTGGR